MQNVPPAVLRVVAFADKLLPAARRPPPALLFLPPVGSTPTPCSTAVDLTKGLVGGSASLLVGGMTSVVGGVLSGVGVDLPTAITEFGHEFGHHDGDDDELKENWDEEMLDEACDLLTMVCGNPQLPLADCSHSAQPPFTTLAAGFTLPLLTA